MILRILGTSRYLIVVAVLGSFLSATTLIIYGGLAVINIMLATLTQGPPDTTGAKNLSVAFIEMIDVFLLGTVLYIIAAGLYTLFVGHLPLPAWLQIDSLDKLKSQLIMVIVVLLAVTFLGVVVKEQGGLDLLYLGVAVALVIGALGYILRMNQYSVVLPPDVIEQQANIISISQPNAKE